MLAVIAGLLIFPLGSALAMPDWYINAARALAPWNYAFKFPDPPQGPRGQLLSADTLKLTIGLVVSLGAAAFALFGRDYIEARQRASSPPDGGSDHPGEAPADDWEEADEPMEMVDSDELRRGDPPPDQ